jgi:hypothetical protein
MCDVLECFVSSDKLENLFPLPSHDKVGMEVTLHAVCTLTSLIFKYIHISNTSQALLEVTKPPNSFPFTSYWNRCWVISMLLVMTVGLENRKYGHRDPLC